MSPEQFLCPICDSKAKRVYEDSIAYLFRCPKCSHCFSLFPEGSRLDEEIYNESYYAEKHANWFANPDKHFFRRF